MPWVSSCFFFSSFASKRESMSTFTLTFPLAEEPNLVFLVSSSFTCSSSCLCSVSSVLPSAHFLLRLTSCSLRASDFLFDSSNWCRVISKARFTCASSALTTWMFSSSSFPSSIASPSPVLPFLMGIVAAFITDGARIRPNWNSSGFISYRARMCSHWQCSSNAPLYFAGRVICKLVFMNKILSMFRAFVASRGVRISMNAYLPNISQTVIGLPSMIVRPTCSMAVPRKSFNIWSVISGVVFPMNNSRLTFSDSLSRTASIVNVSPVSSCHVLATTNGPAYFLGRPTLTREFKNRIPFKFRHLLA
mmetsp:Transcript_46530/g.113320  ORF Transcript_46530/g.113320 Transcript_46530/m.113320 type:complete len:305 (-) Transcript_46530:883-1797(-)